MLYHSSVIYFFPLADIEKMKWAIENMDLDIADCQKKIGILETMNPWKVSKCQIATLYHLTINSTIWVVQLNTMLASTIYLHLPSFQKYEFHEVDSLASSNEGVVNVQYELSSYHQLLLEWQRVWRHWQFRIWVAIKTNLAMQRFKLL